MTADADRPGHPTATPAPWIVRYAHLVPVGARVLDVACGQGRHARYFAARGCDVLAVDRNPAGLAALAGVPRIETREIDLETGEWPLAGERFDAIVVVHYLYRPLIEPMLAALAPDGALLYDTFARGNEVFGRPVNPDFLLERDELLTRTAGRFTLVAFEQGAIVEDGRRAVVQRIAAVGPARAWPPHLPPAEPESQGPVE